MTYCIFNEDVFFLNFPAFQTDVVAIAEQTKLHPVSYIYLIQGVSVDTIFQSLWFLSGFP